MYAAAKSASAVQRDLLQMYPEKSETGFKWHWPSANQPSQSALGPSCPGHLRWIPASAEFPGASPSGTHRKHFAMIARQLEAALFLILIANSMGLEVYVSVCTCRYVQEYVWMYRVTKNSSSWCASGIFSTGGLDGAGPAPAWSEKGEAPTSTNLVRPSWINMSDANLMWIVSFSRKRAEITLLGESH